MEDLLSVNRLLLDQLTSVAQTHPSINLFLMPFQPAYSRLDGAGERMRSLEGTVRDIERKMGDADGGDMGKFRQSGAQTDAQVLKKVSTRLQDFEAQITAQLSNMQSDFDKKLSHLNRGSSGVKGMDTTTSVAGIETIAEDLDALKYDVGELKDLLNNNKGEINHVRRIVLACEH